MSCEEAEAGFRVVVSLERFFSDERARCYMFAASGRPVRWLTRRLRRAFALPRRVVLLSRGHLLPPDEPLALLAPDDPVEVIPATFSNSTSPEVSLNVRKKRRREVHDEVDGITDHNVTSVPQAESPHVCSPSLSLALPATSTMSCLVPEDVAVGSEADTVAPEPDAGDKLDVMKQRALQLLQQFDAPPPRRRRRVRRRRPARPPSPAEPVVESAAPEPPAPELHSLRLDTEDEVLRSTPKTRTAAAASATPEVNIYEQADSEPELGGSAAEADAAIARECGAVLRNAAASARAARCVHALAATLAPA